MFLKCILLLGFVAITTADDGTLKALMDDLIRAAKDGDMVSKHFTSDFEHGAIDRDLHEKGFSETGKDQEGIHAIAAADSDLHALKEKGLVLENPEFIGKLLKMAKVKEFKKEDFAEGDMKAYIAKLIESTVGEAFLKQEEFSKGHGVDVLKMLGTEPKVPHAGSDHLHDEEEDKNIKTYFKNEDVGLFKAIAELKAAKSLEPPFEKPLPEDLLKSVLHGEEALSEEKYLDILKYLEGLKAESLLGKEKVLATKSQYPIGTEHALKDEIAKSYNPEKAFSSEEALKNHKTFHEEAVSHKKDFMYDEILKHEEAHVYGDDLGIKESSELDEELSPHSFLRELHKTKDLDKAGFDTLLGKKDLVSGEILKEKSLRVDEAKKISTEHFDEAAKKAISSEEILKAGSAEKGLKIGETKDRGIKQEGTHAYEKAKEQAHKDATIPFSEEGKDELLFDEGLKKILSGTKIEAGKTLPETKIHTEETLKKDKALIDGKEVSRKLFEEHDIAKGVSHGIRADEEISKGHGIKLDEDFTKGIHHGIKIDEGIHHGIKVDEDFAKGIHHGIKIDEGIHHGIKVDEDFAKGIHHGTKIDEGISKRIQPGIKVDEHIAKGIHHGIKFDEGISKGIHHGIKVDEGISKGIHHGNKMDEEIAKGIKAADEHFVRGIERHIPALLKKKALEILSHILHMKKCHLVSMKPSELLSIVNCISRSKDPLLCEKFAMCEKKMPPQVILALEMCQKELIPEQALRCSKYEPLYSSPDIPLKIFQCIVKNTRELLPEEKKQMIAFEECARQVKTESCGRIPWG